MSRLTEKQRRAVMRRATEADVTRDFVGFWHGMARWYERHERWTDVMHCCEKILWIADTFGRELPEAYGIQPTTREVVEQRLARARNHLTEEKPNHATQC